MDWTEWGMCSQAVPRDQLKALGHYILQAVLLLSARIRARLCPVAAARGRKVCGCQRCVDGGCWFYVGFDGLGPGQLTHQGNLRLSLAIAFGMRSSEALGRCWDGLCLDDVGLTSEGIMGTFITGRMTIVVFFLLVHLVIRLLGNCPTQKWPDSERLRAWDGGDRCVWREGCSRTCLPQIREHAATQLRPGLTARGIQTIWKQRMSAWGRRRLVPSPTHLLQPISASVPGLIPEAPMGCKGRAGLGGKKMLAWVCSVGPRIPTGRRQRVAVLRVLGGCVGPYGCISSGEQKPRSEERHHPAPNDSDVRVNLNSQTRVRLSVAVTVRMAGPFQVVS